MGCENDFFRNKTSPIELLLLGTLRYLGRGWTFDDIEEATAISLEVHRVFSMHSSVGVVHVFMTDLSLHLLQKRKLTSILLSFLLRDWMVQLVLLMLPIFFAL